MAGVKSTHGVDCWISGSSFRRAQHGLARPEMTGTCVLRYDAQARESGVASEWAADASAAIGQRSLGRSEPAVSR